MADERAKVLVVDDEPSLLEVMRAALAFEGYDVATTQHGDEAIRIIRGGGVDAVITDLKMSPVDGIGVLTEAKKRDA